MKLILSENFLTLRENDYTQYLAHCMDLSLTSVAQLIDQCHNEFYFWEKPPYGWRSVILKRNR